MELDSLRQATSTFTALHASSLARQTAQDERVADLEAELRTDASIADKLATAERRVAELESEASYLRFVAADLWWRPSPGDAVIPDTPPLGSGGAASPGSSTATELPRTPGLGGKFPAPSIGDDGCALHLLA